MERDQVGAHAHAEHPPPAVQVVLPQRLVPLRVAVAAEGVVDEDVEPAVVTLERGHQRGDGVGVLVVDDVGDALADRGHQLAGLLDGLGAPDLRRAAERLLRPVACTTAPERASSTAIARPAPRVAPATRATRPLRGLSMPLSMPPRTDGAA